MQQVLHRNIIKLQHGANLYIKQFSFNIIIYLTLIRKNLINKNAQNKMVIFAIPIITSIFTGLIGGVTLHLANRNQNNQRVGGQSNGDQVVSEETVSRGRERERGDQSGGVGNRGGESIGGELIQLRGFEGGFGNSRSLQQKDEKMQNFSQQISTNQNQQEAARYICPITHAIINSPAQLLCGHCFQKQPLKAQLKKTKKCPVCEKKARCSQIYQSQQYKNTLQAYKAKKRARKWSRERLFQDFGDDKFQYIIGCRKNSIGKGDTTQDILHYSEDEQQNKKQQELKLSRSHFSYKEQGACIDC